MNNLARLPIHSPRAEALSLASMGVRVFPACPSTKRPLISDQLMSASTDPQQTMAWWAKHPHAMVGAVTGSCEGTAAPGFIVIDVDLKSGGPETLAGIEAEHGELSRDLVSSTPGGGLHIWLRWPAGVRIKSRCGVGGIGAGIDVRGCTADGASKGFVIAPGSTRTDGKQYEWAPASPLPFMSNEPGVIPPAWLFLLIFSPVERKGLTAIGILGAGGFAGADPAKWHDIATAKLRASGRNTAGAVGLPSGPLPLDASERLRVYIEKAIKGELEAVRSAAISTQDATINNAALKIHGLIQGAAILGIDTDALIAEVLERYCAAVLAMMVGNPSWRWTRSDAEAKWERCGEAAEPRDLSGIAFTSSTVGGFEGVEFGAPADANTAEIDRLARLPALAYEQERVASAKALGDIRVGALDKAVAKRREELNPADQTAALTLEAPTPWPEPVDGAEVLAGLVAAFKRYVILPDKAAEAMALWVLHAHAHDAASISPLLAFESPEKRCGKSTALGVVGELVPKPLQASNITVATMFRVVEQYQPTVMLDEADTFLPENNELRGILNSGHNRRNAFVYRTVGDDHEPKAFSTWAPKVIAMIGDLPDTLRDRAVVVRLRRKKAGERVERMRLDRPAELAELLSKCARWAADNTEGLKLIDPAPPAGLSDRATDNWRALIAIAEMAGGPWPGTAIQAALALSGLDLESNGEPAVGLELLRDIREVFAADDAPIVIEPHELLGALLVLPESPWGDLGYGKALTTKGVAKLLRPYGVQSQRDKQRRFYRKMDFADAWARYVAEPGIT